MQGHHESQYPRSEPHVKLVAMRKVRRSVGRSVLKWRNLVCLPMILMLSLSLLADDTGAAMLRSTGNVQVNKKQALPTSALFRDDLIETQQGAIARIEATGSTADISPETVIQFEGDELVLEHGSVSVNTSRMLRVRVGCVTVTPVNADWTHYDVTDMDGKVTVAALKNDVYLEAKSAKAQEAKQPAHSDRMTVREGEQKSREEKCGAPPVKESGRLAGRGALMNSPYVQWPAGGVIIGLTCWALCTSGNPVSPSAP
jgi:hypothetical protein